MADSMIHFIPTAMADFIPTVVITVATMVEVTGVAIMAAATAVVIGEVIRITVIVSMEGKTIPDQADQML